MKLVLENVVEVVGITGSIFILVLTISHSLVISIAITTVSLFLYLCAKKSKSKRNRIQLGESIPQIIDQVISGLQSGLSLTEALISLSERGPRSVRALFAEFENLIKSGSSFEASILHLQESFAGASADQLFEALIFAKSLGSSELVTLLRQLATYTRKDLSLRNEIAAKQGWVRNSAHISAAAPWILLLLLSAQPSTAESYSSASGVMVLIAGVLLTALAYLWMSLLSRMPEDKRVFGNVK